MNGSNGNTAGGHTQTFEYANESGEWFVGTKPKISSGSTTPWTTQIARIHVPTYTQFKSNTDLPRLSYLNRAGSQQGMSYPGEDLERVEAAVSPDYEYFMIVTVDVNGTGYFSVYYLSDINAALDEAGISDVNIENIQSQKAFTIPNITNSGVVGSLQGFDISNGANYIYISSQHSPGYSDTSRKIVKIPWGASDPDQFEYVNLAQGCPLDDFGSNYQTELEGLQLIDENDVWLTVAYHDMDTSKTTMNRIFEVSWNSNI